MSGMDLDELAERLFAPAASCSQHMASSDDKRQFVTIVRSNDTRMTLELVMPELAASPGSQPGQLIRFQTRLGWVKIVIPSGVVPGITFRVDVVRGSGAA